MVFEIKYLQKLFITEIQIQIQMIILNFRERSFQVLYKIMRAEFQLSLVHFVSSHYFPSVTESNKKIGGINFALLYFQEIF